MNRWEEFLQWEEREKASMQSLPELLKDREAQVQAKIQVAITDILGLPCPDTISLLAAQAAINVLKASCFTEAVDRAIYPIRRASNAVEIEDGVVDIGGE